MLYILKFDQFSGSSVLDVNGTAKGTMMRGTTPSIFTEVRKIFVLLIVYRLIKGFHLLQTAIM